jgi:UDP-glucose 4-epimerase
MNPGSFVGATTLITGGLGFIGSNLARALVELGATVTVVDSLIPEYGGNRFNIAGLENKLRVEIADVRDEHTLQSLVRGQDYLFNLAGQTSHLDSMQDPYTDMEINCRAQLAILEACRKHNPDIKIVFASTRQIYGRPQRLPVDETHPLQPVDVNGIHKMAGEWYHLLYDRAHDLRACALRLTNTIGPRMRVKDARQTFLGVWIRLVIEGKPFEVWGGQQLRDFTYVDDAVEAFLLAGASEQADGQVFNLGGDQPISLKDLAALLVEVNGGGRFTTRPFPADRQRIDIGDYYADFSRIRAAPLSKRVDLRGYDLMLSSLPNFVERFRREGLKAELHRLGFEPRVLEALHATEQPIPVSFVGTVSRDHQARVDLLAHLCRRTELAVWGQGVDALPKHSPIRQRCRGQAWGRQMYQVLHDSRATLNHHIGIAGKFANNCRLYEATGVGTLLITDWKSNLHELFEPGREVVAYRTQEECVELIQHYLSHEEERASISRAGQQRTLREHTYIQRMQELVAVLKEYR